MSCSSHYIASGYFKVISSQTASLLITVCGNCVCADRAHAGFKPEDSFDFTLCQDQMTIHASY